MNYFADNSNFYPTPPELAAKMVTKVDIKNIKYVLEPSAGKGDLVDFLKDVGYIIDDDWYLRNFCQTNGVRKTSKEALKEAARIACDAKERGRHYRGYDIDCVEADENLRHILKGKEYRVEGDDFLTFYTEKRYDLILMNPPFDRGDEHLLKAISLQKRFGGQIVCLLNAETIRNPYSNTRKELAKQLERFEAEIEYVEDAFKNAERKTDVEVAIVYINIPPQFETKSVLLDELKKAERINVEPPPEYQQLVIGNEMQGAVARYRAEVNAGRKIIQEYEAVRPLFSSKITVEENASNFEKEIAEKPILQLVVGKTSDYSYTPVDINEYLSKVRYKYWYELLHKPAFLGNLTSNLRQEYFSKIEELAQCEFSLSNIYQVKIDIIQNTARGIEAKILELFEKFTHEHSMDCSNNVHYFNGWKTNKAYIINKKVVVPYMRVWSDIWKKFEYRYDLCGFLSDVEKTLEFLDYDKFDKAHRVISSWLEHYESQQQTKDLIFDYFKITCYKKGTVHITFTNEELLRKLNIYGCQRKGWLPPSYGKKRYKDMDDEEKAVIDEFEGEASYNEVFENKDRYIIEPSKMLLLGTGE